jgi:hypothetical protein
LFSLHTFKKDGTIIHTAAAPASPLVEFVMPPNEKTHYEPRKTKTSTLLQTHASNVAAFPSEPRAFDCDELKTVMLHLLQANFDHMVRIGLYIPATEKEVERLKKIPAR